MEFPEVKSNENTSTFRRTEYLRTTPGVHLVRLLPPLYTEYTHYLRGTTIACLGDECPVCANNKKIIAENPENFRNIPEYSYPRFTYYINVLDRTPAKVCQNCETEVKSDLNGNMSAVCPKCSTVLTGEVAPLNKVRVLSRGKELFEQQLKLIQATKRNEKNEPIGIENFDIELAVGSNKQPVPSARLDRMDKVEVPQEEYFDLENAVIRLEVDEVPDLLRGISLKDIFASRKAEQVVVDNTISQELEDELNSTVKGLFGD